MLRLLVVLTTLLVAQFLASPMAAAEVKCGKGQVWNGKTCVIFIGVEGGGGVGSVHRGSRKCVYQGKVIPCSTKQGTWSASYGCHMKLASPQPPKSADVWDGHTDGAIYKCSIMNSPFGVDVWAPTGPQRPDPEDLARQAVESMNLAPIRIGIVPEARSGRVGLIGLPVWLWVDQPSANSWGPISRTASSAGYSVTATARVNRIRWEMGDGNAVSCTNRGTPYASKYGTKPSPSCGYSGYTEDGTYTVRATSYWVVTWSGMGESGTISFSLARSAQITVGELQAVNR